MASVFISYSIHDEAVAKQLYGVLSQAGISTFVAGISIEPGKKWTEEIFQQLRESSWIFFLASRNACSSPAVQQELGASLIQNKIIIPVLLDITPEDLPGWVDAHQAIDPRKAPELLHKTIDAIAERIKIDRFWAGLAIGAIVMFLLVGLRK